MSAVCEEPLGASYHVGTVVCILPEGHEGDHDGGARERQLGDEFAAQMREEEWDREVPS